MLREEVQRLSRQNAVLQQELDEWENAPVTIDFSSEEWGRQWAYSSPPATFTQGYYFPATYQASAYVPIMNAAIIESALESVSSFIFILHRYNNGFNIDKTTLINLVMSPDSAKQMLTLEPVTSVLTDFEGFNTTMICLAVPGRFPAAPNSLMVERVNIKATCLTNSAERFKSFGINEYQESAEDVVSIVEEPKKFQSYDYIARSTDANGQLRHYFGYQLETISSGGEVGQLLNVTTSSWWW